MDKLSDLPPKNDTVKTDEEAAIMNQFFAGSTQSAVRSGPVSSSAETTPSSKLNWKIIGVATVLFIALVNPWIDAIFYKIDNALYLLGIKTLLFAVILTVMCLFI